MSQNLKFDQLLKLIKEFSNLGISKGISMLYTEDLALEGRHITLNGKKHVHFGSCSYLGLELDKRLKEAAIEAVNKYGSLFSCSRTYVSSGNYKELEDLLGVMYNAPILLTTNISLGHHSVMPFTIGSNDMIIFDQQAHISMHELSYKLSHYGTAVTILRHNRLDELEQKIKQNKSIYDKIWYAIDGVYSMFGDPAPIKEIERLLNKHKKLWLYVDDAHGISWAGPHGTGYILSQINLHPKMVMATSLAKGFGSCGGLFIFSNTEMRDRVKYWGGPLTYSGPQEPATIAAAVASAKIHLSDEIYVLQKKLNKKINFCNTIMQHYKIPLVSVSESPIFYIACGLPRVGFNLVERLMSEGFYTNLGVFPAVPENCTGVRFTLTNHIYDEDIEGLAKAIAHHLPKALSEEGRNMNDIYKAFRKYTDFESRYGAVDENVPLPKSETSALELKVYDTIKKIDKEIWNTLLADRGAFDYDNLCLLEEVFNGNAKTEDNWKFFYYLVFNNKNEVVLATFFTSALSKDDMLAPEKISAKIEEIRKSDAYYLTSRTFMMGSLLTNGDHLYINRENSRWKEAMMLMLDAVWNDRDNENANALFIRDINSEDNELTLFLINQGFFKIDNLENNVIPELRNLDFDGFINNRLNTKKRHQLNIEVISNINDFEYVIDEIKNTDDIDILYDLYKAVKKNSLILNTFDLPKELFQRIIEANNWEVGKLFYKNENKLVAMSLCLKTRNNMCAVIYGGDNAYNKKFNIYKKMLYFVLKRTFEINADNLYLGITANDTKRKFGAEQIKQAAFVQIKDKYNQELIDSMAFDK